MTENSNREKEQKTLKERRKGETAGWVGGREDGDVKLG